MNRIYKTNMPFLYKRQFEIVPQNNITEFKATGGVNQINFLIPNVPALLSTQDLVLCGNLQVNLDTTTTPPTPMDKDDLQAEGNASGVSLDSVLGVHSIISRVDLISARGNTLIEQRLNYQVIQKYQRGVQSAANLNAGRFNNQQLVSSAVRGTRNFLTRSDGEDDGQSFAIQLNTGLLKNNAQALNLAGLGGLLIRVYLAEPIDAFFNIVPNAVTPATNINTNFSYTLRNVKMVGRYNYATSDVLNQMPSVTYKKTTNLVSVIQSSNDTLTNMPQVMAMHKMIYVHQPNSETSNNKDLNNYATNQLIGLQNYLLSMNGVRMPLDYEVVVAPALSDLPLDSGLDARVTGSAEKDYLSIGALNDQFPPTHSLVNAKNQAAGLYNSYVNQNLDTKNVDVIAMNYSYNFEGYTVAVPNDMLSINAVSGVKTNQVNLPDGTLASRNIRNQSQTQNLFVEYEASLNYTGMNTQN